MHSLFYLEIGRLLFSPQQWHKTLAARYFTAKEASQYQGLGLISNAQSFVCEVVVLPLQDQDADAGLKTVHKEVKP